VPKHASNGYWRRIYNGLNVRQSESFSQSE